MAAYGKAPPLPRFQMAGQGARAAQQHEESAMDQPHGGGLLVLPLLLLAVAVISVPLGRLLRLSPIVAYLAAGVVVGPFGLAVVRERETIVAVSELGVVLLLFLIGLELEFSRLLALRRAIFGLGAAQLILTATALGGLALALGLTGWRGAIIGGLALAMSATAIALKILEDRGQLQQTYGQRAFDPVVPGYVGGADPRPVAPAGARRGQPHHRFYRDLVRGRPHRCRHCGCGDCRTLPA